MGIVTVDVEMMAKSPAKVQFTIKETAPK